MSTSRALASFFTSLGHDEFRKDHLKLCVLWYDEVLFETVGNFDKDRFFERLVGEGSGARSTIRALTDLLLPLNTKVSPDVLEHLTATEPLGYPRWGERHEEYTFPEPETPEEYAHNHLLSKIASEHGVERFTDGHDIQQAEGRARVAVNAVRLWNQINRELPCMLQANPDEKLAMTAVQEFAATSPAPLEPFRLFEIESPSLTNVSWSKIVEFRRSGSLAMLRGKMAEAVERAGTNIEDARHSFDELESNLIDEIVDAARPQPKKVAIEALLANIPGLPVNPASVYFGIRDSASAVNRNSQHGWLYLLRDIRAAGREQETDS